MSLLSKMRKENPRMFDVKLLDRPLPKSKLLEDIKEGKKPETKHIPLTEFFK
ncbi:hypothetical protein ES702_01446 [subsurface metagenome]